MDDVGETAHSDRLCRKFLSAKANPLNSDDSSISQLWVCWSKPTELPDANGTILSFLSPSSEEELRREYGGNIIYAREASVPVRDDARNFYVNLVARIGTAPLARNLTLRQALAKPGEASQWWYHHVAFKDSESDPTFNWIIAVLTIQTIAEKYGLKRLVLIGASWEVAAVLRSAFVVEERYTRQPEHAWWIWLRGLGSRAAYALTALRHRMAIRDQKKILDESCDVALSGFWDWSVQWDNHVQSLADRYFQRLPDELRKQGISSIMWLVWLDPHLEPGQKGRRLKDVLAPLAGRDNVVILQAFLKVWDILRAVGDFSPLARFLRVRRRLEFKEIFRENGIDYHPLFAKRLLEGFLNCSLPHLNLVALATERACQRYNPRVALSFLEHFPYSRAYYEGMRRAKKGTICFAVQHSSYNHEKTFLFLHPILESKGEPDGCEMPHPDYVCVMGTFGQELFLECGYPKECVLVTGSPRYDHVGLLSDPLHLSQWGKKEGGCIRILMVSSLNVEVEVDMVEAVASAVRDMDGVKLFLRNHPFSRIEQHPRFAAYKDQIELTYGSLQEDLEHADLILFTYSTVAEEAFLQGKAVWQWLPLQFNGSALSEAVTILHFGSVATLREAIQEFCRHPAKFLPSLETRQCALERLFYRGDGQAARRISKEVKAFLLGKPAQGEARVNAFF